MPKITYHLKADIKFEAESINNAKSDLIDIFEDFERGGDRLTEYEGQITLESEEPPAAS